MYKIDQHRATNTLVFMDTWMKETKKTKTNTSGPHWILHTFHRQKSHHGRHRPWWSIDGLDWIGNMTQHETSCHDAFLGFFYIPHASTTTSS